MTERPRDSDLGERLRALLLAGPRAGLAAGASAALGDGRAGAVSTTHPLPVADLRRIYGRRATAAPAPGARREAVAGYDDLLPALAREARETPDGAAAELRVHRFRAGETSYIVFTDAAVGRLVAVLTSRLR
jgi:hypothetical protein